MALDGRYSSSNQWLFPDEVERLARLRLEGYPLGYTLCFCPRCDFQYERGAVGVMRCPDCGTAPLHVSRIDADLIALTQQHQVPDG